MWKRIIASVVALLLLQASIIAGLKVDESDAVLSSFASASSLSEVPLSREKRNLGLLLVPIIESFCSAQCATISKKITNELLKAMLPCSSVCKLINVVVKSAASGITELTGGTTSQWKTENPSQSHTQEAHCKRKRLLMNISLVIKTHHFPTSGDGEVIYLSF